MTDWKREVQVSETKWWKEVNRWLWIRDGYEILKSGSCPQCEHEMVYSRRLVAMSNLVEKEVDIKAPKLYDPPIPGKGVEIACNCTGHHSGRDDKVEGCGFYGFFTKPI
jgi:hypothetical protein